MPLLMLASVYLFAIIIFIQQFNFVDISIYFLLLYADYVVLYLSLVVVNLHLLL